MDASFDALTRNLFKLLHGQELRISFFRLGYNGASQGMFRQLFQRGGDLEQIILCDTAVTRQVSHHWLALGDGAGLIHDHYIYTVGSLQSFCGFNEDAVRCASAGAYHDGSRSRQSQSAGAGDHQYRYRDGHGELKGRAADQPYHHRKKGDTDDDWHKNPSHLVGQFGDRSLGAGGFVHQLDDLTEGGLVAHFVGPHPEIAALVDGGTDDLISSLLVHGNALASNGALIHRAAALKQHAVHRNALSGLDDQNVAFLHLFGGNDSFHTVPNHRGLLGGQVHQLIDGVRGAALGPRLKEFAQSDEGKDGACSLKIEVMGELVHHCQISITKAPGNLIKGIYSISQRGPGAQGDQRVHVG